MTSEEREELRKTADKGYKAKVAKEVISEILEQHFNDAVCSLLWKPELTQQKAFEIALEMRANARLKNSLDNAISLGNLAQEELIKNGE